MTWRLEIVGIFPFLFITLDVGIKEDDVPEEDGFLETELESETVLANEDGSRMGFCGSLREPLRGARR